MTTVAWDGQTLAADTLGSERSGLMLRMSKLKDFSWRVSGKQQGDMHLGLSGNVAHIEKFFKNIKNTSLEDILDFGIEVNAEAMDFSCIAILRKSPGGEILIFQVYDGFFIQVDPTSMHAIGSGRDFALAAMHLGKSAVDAVALASRFDINTGGEIESKHFKGNEAKNLLQMSHDQGDKNDE